MGRDDPAPRADMASTRNFDELYQANVGLVFRFIYGRVGQREEAEDLTAQVFIKALRGIDWSRSAEVQRHWLFQVASTVLVDHWRSHERIATISLDALQERGWQETEVTDIPTREPEGATALVAQILDLLPERYRAVLRCRFLLNYTIAETARTLELSEANVKVLQLRALKRAAALHQGPLDGTKLREEASADGR